MARKCNLRRKVERRIERVKSKLAKRAFHKKKAEAERIAKQKREEKKGGSAS